MYKCFRANQTRKQKQNQKGRLGRFLWEILINLGIDYKTVKFVHINDKYIYIYELPLNNWAVVEYEADDETMIFSQFFWEWADALHCFNQLRKEKE